MEFLQDIYDITRQGLSWTYFVVSYLNSLLDLIRSTYREHQREFQYKGGYFLQMHLYQVSADNSQIIWKQIPFWQAMLRIDPEYFSLVVSLPVRFN